MSNMSNMSDMSNNLLFWKSYDDTKNGLIETSTLHYKSAYYHYIVWGIVTVTIVGLVMNILMDPEENATSSLLIIGLLLVVYGISTFIGKFSEESIPSSSTNKDIIINIPDFKMPDFKMPEFKMPDFKMPDFKMPDFSMPSFHKSSSSSSSNKKNKISPLSCNRSQWYMN